MPSQIRTICRESWSTSLFMQAIFSPGCPLFGGGGGGWGLEDSGRRDRILYKATARAASRCVPAFSSRGDYLGLEAAVPVMPEHPTLPSSYLPQPLESWPVEERPESSDDNAATCEPVGCRPWYIMVSRQGRGSSHRGTWDSVEIKRGAGGLLEGVGLRRECRDQLSAKALRPDPSVGGWNCFA